MLQRLAFPAAPTDTLLLMNRWHPRSHRSWLHKRFRLVKGPPRCLLRLHSDDATARGLRDGDLAELRSRARVLQVQVELTDALMRGVASLPHGCAPPPHT
jgi:anaerobic selenocysteine-containing dehydrogenase